MTRCHLGHAWLARTDAANLRHALLGFFMRHEMTVVRDDGTTIEVTQGSQLRTRLLGGWFVSPRHFPKRAVVAITPCEGGARVDAHIEETLGFGILDPLFEERYRTYFHQWMTELTQTLV